MYSAQKSAKGEQLMQKLNMGNLNVAEQYPSAQTFMNGGGIQKQMSYVGAGLAQEPQISYGA